MNEPCLITTPQEALGEIVEDLVLLEGKEFRISRPTDSDLILNDPTVHEAFQRDEYMPYWADLWPGARMLGKALLREDWPTGLTALEVGCGLGLAGVVAMSVGICVIFSDYDATALEFAKENAVLNEQENFELLHMDWRFPPADLKVPMMLASDVIYEERNIDPLIRLMKTVLTPDGFCLLSDQDRVPSKQFQAALREKKLEFTTQMMRAGEPGGTRVKGTVYRITLS